jgi:hypothetical protein
MKFNWKYGASYRYSTHDIFSIFPHRCNECDKMVWLEKMRREWGFFGFAYICNGCKK